MQGTYVPRGDEFQDIVSVGLKLNPQRHTSQFSPLICISNVIFEVCIRIQSPLS